MAASWPKAALPCPIWTIHKTLSTWSRPSTPCAPPTRFWPTTTAATAACWQRWPRFTRNQSERFEARLSLVEVLDSPSIFLSGMAGTRLPIAVAQRAALGRLVCSGTKGRERFLYNRPNIQPTYRFAN
ncbi:MAG: phosphoribosylformylglycinamidine synthase subunit PurQ [Rhodoferax sp.]|nr:phosphoribosylformylglycinamidine synthase subunit PurQ [Rhodoferax sp.]